MNVLLSCPIYVTVALLPLRTIATCPKAMNDTSLTSSILSLLVTHSIPNSIDDNQLLTDRISKPNLHFIKQVLEGLRDDLDCVLIKLNLDEEYIAPE